jgi:hypothetical protein
MKEYFNLQFKRQIRIIRDFGLNPYVGILVGPAIFIWISFIIFKKVFYPQYFYSFICLVLVSTLGDKSRNEFLKTIFTRKKYFYTRLLENLIFAAPFFIFLLAKKQYAIAFATILLSLFISLFNSRTKSRFVIPSPFSKRPFEFTIGFRRTFWLLTIILSLTVISIVYSNFNLGIFCLLGLFLVCLTYYAGQEPVFYVWIHAQSPKEFLKEKIKTALYYSFLLSLFIAIPLVCFNPANGWIVVIIMAIGLLDMVLIVAAIYANYPVRLNLIQNIQIGIAILFPPFLLYAIPNLYAQSIRRLNVILK